MKRLVKVVSGRGNPVLDTTRDGSPHVMNHPERCIAMANLIWRNDASGYQVVHLIKVDFLSPELLPDGIKALHPAFHSDKWHFRLTHLLLDTRSNSAEKCFIFSAPFFELFGKLTVIIRMKVTKGEIFQLSPKFPHSQTVGDGRVNFHRLLR